MKVRNHINRIHCREKVNESRFRSRCIIFNFTIAIFLLQVFYRRKLYTQKETVPGHSDWGKNASIKEREV